MRKGEKCIFTVSEDMFDGKLKKGHRYTGKYWLPTLVYYRNWHVPVATVEPIKKPTVKKEKAPTASDYKKFGDICFECGIRYRDNWTSIISGKRFSEGDWNGLQAGHGVSRQHWATRHDPMNCHAITSGENFHMSLGTTSTIAKYWRYVSKKYGQDVVDRLLDNKPESPKLTIAYLKEDCKKQYKFLGDCIIQYLRKNRLFEAHVCPSGYVKWRCENLPKKQAEGVLKVLKIITGGQI